MRSMRVAGSTMSKLLWSKLYDKMKTCLTSCFSRSKYKYTHTLSASKRVWSACVMYSVRSLWTWHRTYHKRCQPITKHINSDPKVMVIDIENYYEETKYLIYRILNPILEMNIPCFNEQYICTINMKKGLNFSRTQILWNEINHTL